MARLRLKETAEAHGLNMSQLQRQSGLTMGVIRRYWYNTADGLADGKPLEMISLQHINRLADILSVKPGDLLEEKTESVEGHKAPALVAA